MLVKGFNHLTINVKNLDKSLDFYTQILGLMIRHKGNKDAYLEWGTAWICLVEQENYSENIERKLGFDHIAFYIEEEYFMDAVKVLQENEVHIVRGPIQRGLGWTINFLDPDGIQLELHTSNLEERMKIWK
ncbi:VOC family protein [Paenibacillus sp. 1182]|jgi:metallothiol transferase|uniref:VOC family protein n=1 Tax=Paenibacillus TaxID=44249 RepID=UPI000FB76EF4|nr:VOC family protein [Paenibacillus sp. 1182]MBP1312023.1 metallothiol transferase [Paenibacillus sp. 1182]